MNGSTLPERELLSNLIGELEEFVVVLLDREGKFTSWHPGVGRQFGYAPEEWLGQPASILFPEPDRSDGTSERELKQASTAGRASDTRYLLTKSGHPILVEGVSIALRGPTGELLGFGKVLRDVTEWKNAKESLIALGRALDQSTIIVRQWNGTIDHWTAGCERLYGWAPQEAVGRLVQDLLQTKFPAPLADIEKQLLTSGTWNGELEHVRQDGSCVVVSTYWALLNDPSDEVLNVIETHIDVTGRLQIQEELQEANQRLQTMALELERSNQELEQFARIASHDLSAPLTSTRWLVDLLSTRHSEKLEGNGRKILKQISQGLERMSDLVEAVLAHAQVGTSAIGTLRAEPASEGVQIAIENLQRHIVDSEASINYASLPSVNVDKQALRQLFQNLLSNAIKYRSPERAPVIQVSAKYSGALWQFAVSDNGIGIEPEWHERIFQPMQRRHGMEIAGSGIGLATCKKIVTRAGGQIWVDSQPGAGATFYFTLPGPAGD
jgi:PAS domain S-box-containing protein